MFIRALKFLIFLSALPAFAQNISGTVYTDQGVTNIGAGVTVSISINGAAVSGSDDTDGSGTYAVTGLTLSSGDVITAFIDDEIQNGVTVTLSDGTAPTNFDIYQDHLVVREDSGNFLTRTHLDLADNSSDTDITSILTSTSPINITGNLYVGSGEFRPSSSTTVSNDIVIAGLLNLQSQDLNISGDFSTEATGFVTCTASNTVTIGGSVTFDPASTLEFGYSSSGPILPTHFGSSWPNVSIRSYSNNNNFTLPDTDIQITGLLTLSNSTLIFDDDKNLTVEGGINSTGGGLTNLGVGDLILGGDYYTGPATTNVIFNSSGGIFGDPDGIQIRSTVPGIQRTWTGGASKKIYDVDVQDMVASGSTIYLYSSTDSGNNVNWVFDDFVSITGQVLQNDRATNLGAGINVSIGSAGEIAMASAVTDGSGNFTLNNVALTTGDTYNVYLDDEVQDGVTVHYASNRTPPVGLEIFVDHLTIFSSYTNPMTLNSTGDSDLSSIHNGSTLVDGKTWYVPVGASYESRTTRVGTTGTSSELIIDGSMSLAGGCSPFEIYGDVTINGNLSFPNCDISLNGDLTNNSANSVGSNLILTGSNQTISDSASSYINITSNNQAKTVTIAGTLSATGDFSNDQTLNLDGGTLDIEGNFINTGAITGSGTVELTGSNTTGFNPGTTYDVDLIINKTFSYRGVSLLTNLNLTSSDLIIREGVFGAQSYNLIAPNTFDIESGGQLQRHLTGGTTFSAFTTQPGGNVRYDMTIPTTIPNTITNFNGSLDLQISNTVATMPDNDFSIAGRISVGGGGTLILDDDKELAADQVRIFPGATLSSSGSANLIIGTGGIANDGNLELNSMGGSIYGGDADSIQIRSSSSGVQRAWTGTGNFTLVDVDIQDQNNSTGSTIPVYSSTDSGNNSNFIFDPAVAGRVYAADRTTPLPSKTISFSINGGAVTTSLSTDANGFYLIPSLSLSSGDVITAFIDDEIEKGVTVTVTDGTMLPNFNIYQDYLAIRNDNGSSTDLNALATADDNGDSDISDIYTVSVVTLDSQNILIEGSYFPGSARNTNATGNLTIISEGHLSFSGTLNVAGTFTMEAGATYQRFYTGPVPVFGALNIDPTSTVIYGKNGNGELPGEFNYNFPNLFLDSFGGSSFVDLPDSDVIVNGDLTLGRILNFDDDKNLTVYGDFIVGSRTVNNLGSGDLVLGGQAVIGAFGTLYFDSASNGLGDADQIQIRSTSPGTQRAWTGDNRADFTLIDVDISDQDNQVVPAVFAYSSTDSGNNLNFSFDGTGATISGQVFQSDRATTVGAGLTVSVAQQENSALASATTDGTGNFTLTGVPLSPGLIYNFYLDDEVENGVTAFSLNGVSPPASLEIYVDHLTVSSDISAFIDDRDIVNTGDSDLAEIFDVGPTIVNGNTHLIDSNITYHMRNGNMGSSGDTSTMIVDGRLITQFCANRVFYGDIILNGSFSFTSGTGENCPTTVHGDITVNNSGFDWDLILAGSNQTINDTFSTYHSIASNGQAKTINIVGTLSSEDDFDNDQDLIINGGTLRIAGDSTNTGSISGTATFEFTATGDSNFDPGANFDANLLINKSNLDDAVVLANPLTLVSSNLVVREGTFNSLVHNTSAPNIFDIEDNGRYRVTVNSATFSPFTTQLGSFIRYDYTTNGAIPTTVLNFNGSLQISSNSTTTTFPDADFSINENLTLNDGLFEMDDDKNLSSGELIISSDATLNSTGASRLTIGSGGVQNDGTLVLNSGGGNQFGGDLDTIQIRSSSSGVQRTWTGTGSFTLIDVDVQDQNNATGTGIIAVSSTDSGNNLNFTFLDSALLAPSVTLADTSATVTTAATISFTTTNPVPANGQIVINFPAGFDISGISGASSSDIDGTLSIQSITGQLLVLERTGGTTLSSSSTISDLLVSGIVNPSSAGATGMFQISSRDASNLNIDTGNAPGVTITDAPITGFTISGQVMLSNLGTSPVPGVTVTAGSSSTISDADGNYTLSNLQTDDIVSISSDGFKPDSNTSDQFVVGSSNATDIDFVLTPTLSQSSYSGWNTFLEMTAILELSNSSSSKESFELIIFDALGQEVGRLTLSLNPSEKRDIILNDFLDGANQYGTIQILSSSGAYAGRVMHYRPNVSGEIEFAYNVELSSARTGKSAAGYNAFQPSTNPEDSQFLVSNWLSLVNLSNLTQGFQVKRYDSTGTLLLDDIYFLPAMGRVDLEGGHLLGQGAGINLVDPLDPSAKYISFQTRYGDIGTEASGVLGYYFASSEHLQAPDSDNHFVSLGNSTTWLEISNISDSLEEVSLEILGADGVQLHKETFGQPAKTQRHFDVTPFLENYDSGYVKLITASSSKVILQAVEYKEISSGSVEALSVTTGKDVFGTATANEFNSFFNTENQLRLTNISSSFQQVTIRSDSFDSINLSLGPEASKVVSLPLVEDSYGEIIIEATTSGAVLSELVRNGSNEFSITTRSR